MKTRDAVENSGAFSQTLLSFSPGYEGVDNMFYFFYKIIFRLNKQKDYIQSTYVYFKFSQLGDSRPYC